MKYTLLLITTVSAVSSPWPVHSDLYIPVYLERRMMSNSGGKGKVKTVTGKGDFLKPNKPLGPGRSDSPPKDGDTRVSGKVTAGPGWVASHREKNHKEDMAMDEVHLTQGQRSTKATHDARWSKASARADGKPPPNANKQSHKLHPAKAEGIGQSGNAELNPPPGGYGQFKKEVNGEVVMDQRVKGGQSFVDDHRGHRPEEVKYTISTSRGGEAYVNMNNVQESTNRIESSHDDSDMPSSSGRT